MKKITLLVCCILWSLNFYSQGVPAGCGELFFDGNDPTVNYALNSNVTTTICPDVPGNLVTVTFVSFETEANYDGMYVHDGNSVNSPMISSGNPSGFGAALSQPGAFWGSTIPGPFTSSSADGCLTFVFRSDGSGTQAGWMANVVCEPSCAMPQNVTISTIGNSATIDWTETGSAQNWEVVFLPCGSTPPAFEDIGESTTMHPLAIALPGGQDCLDVYVRSVCDPQHRSPWSSSNVIVEGEMVYLSAFFDANENNIKDSGELPFTAGEFVVIKNQGAPVQYYNPFGGVQITALTTDTIQVGFTVSQGWNDFYGATDALLFITMPETGPAFLEIPVVLTQTVQDVAISIQEISPPRPDLEYSNVITVTNMGNVPASGTVTFTKDPVSNIVLVDADSASELTPNGFTHAYSDLAPFNSTFIYVTLEIPAIPEVSMGQILTNTVSVASATQDDNSANNSNSLSQTVVASYDPNDITERHGPEIDVDTFAAGDYLYYTIRFQNTGTADALHVRLENTLPEAIYASTFQMVAASHDYVLTRSNYNQLIWDFENINLTFASQNEAESQGFVVYRVQMMAEAVVGDSIQNTAEIYFDSNPAIVTNTFETLFVEQLDLNSEIFADVAIYPNPARAMLSISHAGMTLQSVQVYDVLGKLVKVPAVLNAMGSNLDVSGLNAGLYFLRITSDSGKTMTRKLIVK